MNLFLSYSTQDHHYKDEIKKTLSKLERDGKIKLWVDEKELKAGEEFNEIIEAEIRNADMFLLLLSRDFWASDYIQRDELPLILERYRDKEVIVVPIVLKDDYDLIGHDELNKLNGLPRNDVGDKRLKPIDAFISKDKAYNHILQEIIKLLPQNDNIEVYKGATHKFVKVFVGHSYRDKNSVNNIVAKLDIPRENIEICSDVKSDMQWQKSMYEAIVKAEFVALFLSKAFLESDFIQSHILPLLYRQYHIGKCSVSVFLLEVCNFKKDIFLQEFIPQPLEHLTSLITKESNNAYEKIELDFPKIFLLYKVIQKYDKDKNQSVKLNDNSSIELYEDSILIERWEFVGAKERIEEYAELYKNSFDIKESSFKFGLFQESDLVADIAKLQHFFETIFNVYRADISKESIAFLLSPFSNLSSFVQTITDNKIFDIGGFNCNKEINNEDSIFLFLRFSLEGYSENKLIYTMYKLIEKKFNISISEDNGEIYSPKSFAKTFEKALILLKRNREIAFSKIISSIDLLGSTLELMEDMDFIEQNIALIKTPIVQNTQTDIAQLFVEPRAKLHYTTTDKVDSIKNVSDWFYDNLEHRDFILLLGNFGHGKTTLLKYLVSNLSKNYCLGGAIPVFLTLREHFKTESSLQEAVTNAIMINSRMSDDFWKDNQWIIFCDGFDELNIFHQENPQWITLVFSQLLKASQENNIKIVISSRPILFMNQEIKSKTVAKFSTLVLDEFNDKQIEVWLDNWSQSNFKITIKMLRDRGILGIARTPIILFLIALMFYDKLIDSKETYSVSKVYKLFFDWTISSGGFIGDDKIIKHKVPQNYREIIQETAWQIFTHPDSKSGLLHYKILLKELEARLEIDIFDVWDERIFVAHAFKERKKEHIEFLHQSLREYLVAEKLFGVYVAMIDEPEHQIDIGYEKILLSKPLTEAKVNFFVDMTRNLALEEKEVLQIKAKNIAHWSTILYQIIEKDPTYLQGYSVYRKENDTITVQHLFAQNQVVLANLVLLGYLFEANLYEELAEEFNIELFTQIQSFFKSDKQLEVFEDILKNFFTNLNFTHNEFNGCDFYNYSFKKITFDKVSFNSCDFNHSKFFDVDFKDVIFSSSLFEGLEYSTFKHHGECQYRNCTFEKLNYNNRVNNEKVLYIDCLFIDSDIYYENFSGATFQDCIFKNSHFLTNESINTEDIEFIHSIIKTKDTYEVLNGYRVDMFESNIG